MFILLLFIYSLRCKQRIATIFTELLLSQGIFQALPRCHRSFLDILRRLGLQSVLLLIRKNRIIAELPILFRDFEKIWLSVGAHLDSEVRRVYDEGSETQCIELIINIPNVFFKSNHPRNLALLTNWNGFFARLGWLRYLLQYHVFDRRLAWIFVFGWDSESTIEEVVAGDVEIEGDRAVTILVYGLCVEFAGFLIEVPWKL